MRFAFLLTLLLVTPQFVTAAEKAKSKTIDLVVCLDTSGSMDGLIESAKKKLWTIVNDLAKVDPTPDLRVALYSYGNNTYPEASGWVRKELDLTTDLDEVHNNLFKLKTAPANSLEYVARVTQAALQEMKWSEGDGLKIIFVCGNEPADQDPSLSLEKVAEVAKKKGILLNTIYCGGERDQEALSWKNLSTLAKSEFAHIDQNRAAAEVSIATPFDKELAELGLKINSTYLACGKEGERGALNQTRQDGNALAAQSSVERSITKAGALYKNAEWDLLDKMKADKDFTWRKLKEDELPADLKKLKPEERDTLVKQKLEDREKIQKRIAELNVQRTKCLEETRAKMPANPAEKAFDDAVGKILRDQAATKGLKTKE
jgi:hypothetical protein